LILFLTWLGPKLLRADLRSEAKALEKTLAAGAGESQSFSGAHLGLRAYVLANTHFAGSSVDAFERLAWRGADVRPTRQARGRGLALTPALDAPAG
jgi:hypothetical protein